MKYQIAINGTMPLLMNSDTLADPLNPLTKEFKKISGKKVKTDEDHEAMSRMEFMAGLYLDDDGRVVIPSANVKKCLIEGARNSRSGPKVEQGVIMLGIDFPLIYDGPRDKESLYQDKRHVDRRSVVQSMKRVMRTRPVFKQWGLNVEVYIDTSILSLDDLVLFATTAGENKGLGDYRKVGGYGRFTSVITPI